MRLPFPVENMSSPIPDFPCAKVLLTPSTSRNHICVRMKILLYRSIQNITKYHIVSNLWKFHCVRDVCPCIVMIATSYHLGSSDSRGRLEDERGAVGFAWSQSVLGFVATGGEKGLQAWPLQSSVGISVFSGRTNLVAFETNRITLSMWLGVTEFSSTRIRRNQTGCLGKR